MIIWQALGVAAAYAFAALAFGVKHFLGVEPALAVVALGLLIALTLVGVGLTYLLQFAQSYPTRLAYQRRLHPEQKAASRRRLLIVYGATAAPTWSAASAP
jgi:hypothetical protein